MELIRGLSGLKPAHHGCVLSIGNFDGVHRGHQVIIKQLNQLGQQLGLSGTLLTFEPLPREVLNPAEAPARLNRLREKLTALQQYGIERVLCVRFAPAFASLSPEQFIREVLIKKLGIKAIVVGDDFRFGHKGRGDIALLRTAGKQHGFTVHDCARFMLRGRRVSSSWLRQALAEGDLKLAQELLGRPYAIQGRVNHGDQIGRTLGFPTANIPLCRRKSPLAGVFAVRVNGLQSAPIKGVANIGRRPTIAGRDERIEVHLLDFNDTIYGRLVTVEIVQNIRPERKFDSLAALQAQIQHDITQARQYFLSSETLSC